jgi:protein-S-isoprenylcysteine O-methyltransferase Ste14
MKDKKILPPRYFMVTIILQVLIHFAFPFLRLLLFPENLIGIIFIVAGTVLNISADRAFKEANSTVKPFEESSQLMTQGVFKISRNPMYFGMFLVLIGIAAILGSLIPFILSFIFAWIMKRRFILIEEKMLLEKFGNEWLFYKNDVRRWV